MKRFVISLDTSSDRRDSIRRQFDALGVDFDFFDAIDVRRDRRSYFHHCDDRAFQLRTGRSPTAGEIGCFASHLMLWRTCRLLNEPIAIFEDDAGIRPDFPAGLSLAACHVRRLGFVRLQTNEKQLSVPVVRQGPRAIGYCLRYPHGSMAYLISPAVADVFARQCTVFDAPLDCFIKDFWRHRQPLYSLHPAIVTASPYTPHTTIAERQRGRQGPVLRANRWCRKRVDSAQRAQFNARQLLRHAEALYRHSGLRGDLAGLLK